MATRLENIPDPTPPITNDLTVLMLGNCLTEAVIAVDIYGLVDFDFI